MKTESFDFYDRTSLKSYNLDKTMQDQLNALGSLDVFTRKHCENVAAITCRLCEYLHCPRGFTEYCIICAYLHDIGKIFIPAKVLQKPGKLTEEEYDIIKSHTTIGYEMCMKDVHLRPYAAGAYCHHEALNGSGYPRGLTKEKIPYEAQIIRVADEYDAIVSKRQYKSHIGITDTLQILIDNSKPPQNNNFNSTIKNPKYGKNNPSAVKCLIKVVLDDINFEIYSVESYIEYIEKHLKRLKTIDGYYRKMQNARNSSKKEYFKEYMKIYFEKGETVDNFLEVYNDYKTAYNARKEKVKTLNDEIKIIKKLKV